MSNNRLKYLGYSVTFQEVPDEVSLVINISGCDRHCDGCHSPHLWKYEGNYISDDIECILDKYKDLITCVCFMGGDQNQQELDMLLKTVQSKNLRTALYSGHDSFNDFISDVLYKLDYLKIGRYDKRLGGLSQESSNQKMYKHNHNTFYWEDITYKFRRQRT